MKSNKNRLGSSQYFSELFATENGFFFSNNLQQSLNARRWPIHIILMNYDDTGDLLRIYFMKSYLFLAGSALYNFVPISTRITFRISFFLIASPSSLEKTE